MSNPPQPQTSGTGSTALVISADIQEKFGPLLDLIKSSESMNMEERQYWINILPVMTPEQLKNLEEILASEKKQLAAIEAKYSKDAVHVPSGASLSSIEEKIQSRKEKRLKVEQEHASKEAMEEEEILAQIQSF